MISVYPLSQLIKGFTNKETRVTGGQVDNESQSGSISGRFNVMEMSQYHQQQHCTSSVNHLTVTDTFTFHLGILIVVNLTQPLEV